MSSCAFHGAKDTTNTRLKIRSRRTPSIPKMTYHGLFFEYYFNAGKIEKQKIFTAEPFCGIVNNLETNEKEYFLSLATKSKYDGEGIQEIGRPKLNCVIVLDISGSMSCSFTGEYHNVESHSSKLEIAKRSLLGLVGHLNDEDNFGVVIFDDDAEELIAFQNFGKIDKEKMNDKINKLKTRGGTNMAEGFIEGSRMIEKYLKSQEKEDLERENRIIFLTDAQPTTGETRSEGLFTLARKASEKAIFTTFIGIGVDFNVELIDIITKTKGANYYSVNSSSEFKRRMDTDFDYVMTPICFDATIKVDGAKILSVYGSPDAESEKETTIANISTVMPSNVNENNEVQGGVLLLKMDKSVGDGLPLNITISFKDKLGKEYQEVINIAFPELQNDQSEFFQDLSIRKAILLVRFVDIVNNFQRNDEGKEKVKKFIDYLEKEIKIIGDEKLNREVELLNDLLK
ncbi:calcium-activated chloride channel regulator [Anaeramoeba ignava]|uniref:Calcium-activated chloride channel regulator n=1 Tax=Anaeramoeba ignava TaxID=1746090 RepID=A0A9Q0L6R4_ANAIG|nr:calcium-activated chloride channel regulator [Anaeramoeba ignava]|eukprot:Anaeramoba_ignava/c21696_g2_i1.p1 GENE.c21696_g2_i1~~c21696_g2_i1.p1  ORF type:complete len:457 (+),score=163.90 c21696_g2_i1:25-1395(+)